MTSPSEAGLSESLPECKLFHPLAGAGNGILRSQNGDSCYETNNTKCCNFRKVCKRLLIGYVETISV